MVPRNEPETPGLGEVVEKVKEAAPLHLKWAKAPFDTQLWRSIFRHKMDDTPRNRSLAVLSNVFLHLHPAKINRDAVRYTFTWGMGGITFYLFLLLTLSGVALISTTTRTRRTPSATSSTSRTMSRWATSSGTCTGGPRTP